LIFLEKGKIVKIFHGLYKMVGNRGGKASLPLGRWTPLMARAWVTPYIWN